MRLLVAIAFVVAVAYAMPSNQMHPLSDEFIAHINSLNTTWKAGRNFKIEEYDRAKIIASGMKKGNYSKPIRTVVHDVSEDIPASFDAREYWASCADIIGLIQDQEQCGSCWAFGAVESMADRICIHSDGERKMLVSAEDLIECPGVGGCNGGWAIDAWTAWMDGLVTGGLYGRTDQGCKSYFLNCAVMPDQCALDDVPTPACRRSCDDSSVDYYSSMTYGQQPYQVKGEKQIQLEVLKNGPAETGMTVFEDFMSYQSGIYQHVSGEDVGGHYVKVFGWGEENGVKYWLMANSWGDVWGESGFFRIIRGQDEAGIETEVTSSLPDFSKF